MTDLRQAAQQALEALQISQDYVQASANAKLAAGWGEQLDRAEKAITALRTALEQQQAEPVMLNGLTEAETNASASVMGLTKQVEPVLQCSFPKCQTTGGCVGACTRSTQSNPPQRKPLTDAQIAALLENCIGSLPVAKQLIRAVEAAHNIQEPKS